MTLEEADPVFTVVYEGKTIAFCCERCLEKFPANPERYAGAITAPGGGRDRASVGDEGDQASGLRKLIAWIGRFHPAVVNFPIAILIVAALAECLLIATGRAYFAGAGRFCLWVGAVAGTLPGWCSAGFQFVDGQWILTTHRWLGSATAAASPVALVVSERVARRTDANRRVLRFAVFTCAGMAAITGFFGGSLVYGLDHYAWQAGYGMPFAKVASSRSRLPEDLPNA